MADYTTSPNMNLPIPTVGVASGPLWATLLDSCLTLLDQHDHTPGNGVRITPNAININTALTMSNNSLTDIQSLVLTAQAALTTPYAVYSRGVDLYYRDGNGVEIAITASGSISGGAGSIGGLVAPATATYNAGTGTFVWASNFPAAGAAANMDFGAAILRNTSPNSTFSLTLQPPLLTANYPITLPYLPSTPRILSIDNTGAMAAGATGVVVAADMAANSIVTASIVDQNVTTAKIADSAVTIVKQGPIDIQGANFATGVPASAGFVNIAVITITAIKADRPILVFITGGPAGNFATVPNGETMVMRILRDGVTNIAQTQIALPAGSGAFNLPLNITIPDSVAAGPHSYTLQAGLSGSIPGFISGALAAIQI